jgi:signal transduction histidine kinase
MRAVGIRVPAAALIVASLLTGAIDGVVVGLMAALLVELTPRCIADRERRAALMAVAEERRRIARELHDGLAQDLAFIAMSGQRLARRGGTNGRVLGALSTAAARALEETRGAIAGLDERADEAIRTSVERTTCELAARFGLEIIVQGEGAGLTDAPRRDVLRLLREAVTNAARHGGARRVTIDLGGEDGVLCVRDDGCGIDAGAPRRAGSRGLRGMEERAARLGGCLITRKEPQGGTSVMVLPSSTVEVA